MPDYDKLMSDMDKRLEHETLMFSLGCWLEENWDDVRTALALAAVAHGDARGASEDAQKTGEDAVAMTRTEFVESFAARSGLSSRWALLGYVKIGGATLIALPCDCHEEGCEGWAMVAPEQVSHQLSFRAPKNLRAAYRETLGGLTV